MLETILTVLYFFVAFIVAIVMYVGIRILARKNPLRDYDLDNPIAIIPSLILGVLWPATPFILVSIAVNLGFERLLNKFFPKE